MYDVTVIGAGVTGCAIARELSRYEVKVCVIDRCSDICEGTSKANSGIVHAGHDAATGSWKAEDDLEGNRMEEAAVRGFGCVLPAERISGSMLSGRG